MNSTAKILIAIALGIVVICLATFAGGIFLFRTAGGAVARTIESDPVAVMQVSEAIADYSVPMGFGEPYSIKLADYSLVSYTGLDGHSHIYLFQLPEGVTIKQEDIDAHLEQVSDYSGKDWVKTEVVDQHTVTINGQEVNLLIGEGVNHEGLPYRHASGIFQGKNGQVVVVVSGPTATWDQAVVDDFLASIR